MRFYLAARYSRREELCDYREQLQAMGHRVTASWLNGGHQISDSGVPIGESGEALVEGDSGSTSPEAVALRQRFAQEDLFEIDEAEVLIAFTEPPRSPHSRGGRHVELGYALGREVPVWIVGYRENIFCWLDHVEFFDDWPAVTEHLETYY